MENIVIIEDNVQNARLAQKVLKRAGYTVHLAENGEDGLNMVFRIKPEIVLVDLGLPDLDGQTVVSLIRQEKALQGTLVIAFTAWPEATAHQMATAYGCDGVITKPIDTRTLAEQVAAFVKTETPARSDNNVTGETH